MNIQQSILRLVTEPPLDAYGNSLRGCISNQFPQYAILHNHREDGSFLYLYPRVQYRIINGEGLIIGIEEGVSLIQTLEPYLETIALKGNTYPIVRKQFISENVQFDLAGSSNTYGFLHPWLALNEQNYSEYMKLGSRWKRHEFLRRILTGNLLSMAKSLGYIVEQEITVPSMA